MKKTGVMMKFVSGIMLVLPFLLALPACNGHADISSTAHILERKMLDNGKLLVSYVFEAGRGQVVADSIQLDTSTVIPYDSVPVTFSPADPRQNQLKVDSLSGQ